MRGLFWVLFYIFSFERMCMIAVYAPWSKLWQSPHQSRHYGVLHKTPFDYDWDLSQSWNQNRQGDILNYPTSTTSPKCRHEGALQAVFRDMFLLHSKQVKSSISDWRLIEQLSMWICREGELLSNLRLWGCCLFLLQSVGFILSCLYLLDCLHTADHLSVSGLWFWFVLWFWSLYLFNIHYPVLVSVMTAQVCTFMTSGKRFMAYFAQNCGKMFELKSFAPNENSGGYSFSNAVVLISNARLLIY